MSLPDILPLTDLHQDYLRDESRLSGHAEYITFPQDTQQVSAALSWAAARQLPVTVQGSRTGITGAAVPQGGLILNLTKMNHIGPVMGNAQDGFTIQVEAGVLCQDLDQQLSRKGLFFAPDPTETTATIGGMFNHNARGICNYRYGATADHVLGITLLQADGTPLTIARGQCVFGQTGCTLPDGRRLELTDLPSFSHTPCLPSCGSDLLDLIAGSEGMLGVVTLLTLQVLPRPEEPWGITFFYDSPEKALAFAESVRTKQLQGVCCMEFFDPTSLALVAQAKELSSQLKALPDFPPDGNAALYLEIADTDAEAVENTLMELLSDFGEQGGSEEQSWAVSGSGELEKFHLMRHTVPEAANMRIDALQRTLPQARKFALDFSLANQPSTALYQFYVDAFTAAGIPGVVWGHAADRHLHCNLLPENAQQLDACPALCTELSRRILAQGGIPCAENGVGKLKVQGLSLSTQQQEIIRSVRRFFDPAGLLNPSNMSL